MPKFERCGRYNRAVTEGPILESERALESGEAVKFLVHLTNTRFLQPFWGRECSLAEAARALEVSKSRMSYWMSKLLELDLIVKLRMEKRGEHQVPIYRSVADVFTFPLEQFPLEWEGGLLERHKRDFDGQEQSSVLGALRQDPERWFVRFAMQGEESRLDILPSGGDKTSVPFVSEWGRVRLDKAQASAFQQELLRLVERYGSQTQTEGDYHLFKLLLIEERLDE